MDSNPSPILEEVFGPFTVPNSDEAIPVRGLEVHLGNDWIPITADMWRSWTGRRRIWGIEHHGPVYAVGTQDESTPWTGVRECACSTCQAHVEPTLKPN